MQHLHQTAPRQPRLAPPFASVSRLEEGNETNIAIGRLSIRLTPFLQNKSGDKRLLSATFDVMRHLIRRKKKVKGEGERGSGDLNRVLATARDFFLSAWAFKGQFRFGLTFSNKRWTSAQKSVMGKKKPWKHDRGQKYLKNESPAAAGTLFTENKQTKCADRRRSSDTYEHLPKQSGEG